MPQTKISCLYRLNSVDPDIEYISLDDKEQVTVGREATNDVVMNKSAFISRQHAKLIKEDGQWAVIDLNSSNGVFVQEERLVPGLATPLCDKDVLELGKDPKTGKAHYTFRFYRAAYLQIGGKENADKSNSSSVPPLKRVRDAIYSPSAATLRRQMADKERLMREEMVEKERVLDEKRREMENKQMLLEEKLKDMTSALASQEERHLELQTEIQTNLRQLEEKEQLLNKERVEKLAAIEQKETEAENRIKELQKELDDKVQKSQEQLHAESEEKEKLSRLLEEQKRERENLEKEEREQILVKQRLEEAVESMKGELSAKSRSQEDMAQHVRQLQENQHALEQHLQSERERLEQKLEQDLQAQHDAMMRELETEKSKMVSMEDVMEEELVCTICSELFLKAMSLGCSHSFCYYCIVEWLLRKAECPNCRASVLSCVPCIVLDNTIDRMVQQLGDDTKQRRAQLAEERKAEQEALENKMKALPANRRAVIDRILNRSTKAAAAAAPGTPDNPIVLAELPAHLGNNFANTLMNYLSPRSRAGVTIPGATAHNPFNIQGQIQMRVHGQGQQQLPMQIPQMHMAPRNPFAAVVANNPARPQTAPHAPHRPATARANATAAAPTTASTGNRAIGAGPTSYRGRGTRGRGGRGQGHHRAQGQRPHGAHQQQQAHAGQSGGSNHRSSGWY